MFNVINMVSRMLGIARKGKQTKEKKNCHFITSIGGILIFEYLFLSCSLHLQEC